MSTPQTPKKPAARKRDWHPADVKAALEKQGTTLRRLSLAAGYSQGTLSAALRRAYPAAESIIAGALGKRPTEIWPSRYDENGQPIRSPRAPHFLRLDSNARRKRSQQQKLARKR